MKSLSIAEAIDHLRDGGVVELERQGYHQSVGAHSANLRDIAYNLGVEQPDDKQLGDYLFPYRITQS